VFDGIERHLISQVNNILIYEDPLFEKVLFKAAPRSKERYLYCLNQKKINHMPNHVIYHANEYASYLYILSNEIWLQTAETEHAEKIYLLNRYLNAIDIFYDRKMPEVFFFEHPVGSVIGRAEIGNYFVLHQGVTVGGNLDWEYPTIGENVVLYSNAMVTGRCVIGKNCQIGAGVILHNETIEDGTTLVMSGNNITINSKRDHKVHYFHSEVRES